jgi:hypothetical protein
MVKINRTTDQTMIYERLRREIKIEQYEHEPHQEQIPKGGNQNPYIKEEQTTQ